MIINQDSEIDEQSPKAIDSGAPPSSTIEDLAER